MRGCAAWAARSALREHPDTRAKPAHGSAEYGRKQNAVMPCHGGAVQQLEGDGALRPCRCKKDKTCSAAEAHDCRMRGVRHGDDLLLLRLAPCRSLALCHLWRVRSDGPVKAIPQPHQLADSAAYDVKQTHVQLVGLTLLVDPLQTMSCNCPLKAPWSMVP